MTINKINITEVLERAAVLLKRDKSASPQIRALIELLIVVINLLLGKLGLNSSNSSTPPSKDTNRERGTKKKTGEGKRKPGGQKGHEGSNLKREAEPDRIVVLKVDRQSLPKGRYKEVDFEARQVIDIEVTKKVTEFRAQVLEDTGGNRFVAEFPAGVTRPVQYGTSVKTQSVYMSQHQLVPYDRVRDYLADQCGIPISTGTVYNFNKQAFDLLEDFESIVRIQLLRKSLLHVDETGINIDGKLVWLHSVSNEEWTLFFAHEKRGIEAMNAMNILPHFMGILCHDHWKPYFHFKCLHSLCNAHHLRELTRAWEQDKQCWAKEMRELLLKMNKAKIKAGGCLEEKAAQRYHLRYREILARGDQECPSIIPKNQGSKPGRIAKTKSRNLLERLRDYEKETLRFLTDKQVPFTNNQGENDIRMTKVQQKISGCFRSFEGAQIFCRIRSYLLTCSKHGVSPTDALNILFAGGLPDFIVKIE